MEAPVSRDNGGFTLIEALIAITLMVLIVLALYRSTALIITRNLENSLQDEAVKVAVEAMENLRTVPFNNLSPGTTVNTVTRKVRNFNQPFTVSRTLVSVSGVYRVTVAVTWTYAGRSHSYSLVSVVANHG